MGFDFIAFGVIGLITKVNIFSNIIDWFLSLIDLCGVHVVGFWAVHRMGSVNFCKNGLILVDDYAVFNIVYLVKITTCICLFVRLPNGLLVVVLLIRTTFCVFHV